MDDPTGFAARSDRRSTRSVTTLDWMIVALGLGLSLLLLAGGLLPARERNARIRQMNERLADDILGTKEDIRQRLERIRDRRNDPITIETEIRDRGGRAPGEIPVTPKDATGRPADKDAQAPR
jgi:hypothetical protein